MNNTFKLINLEDKSIYSTGDAIRAAGLNWEVDSGPITTKTYHIDQYGSRQYGHCSLPNQKAVFRTDSGHPLGGAIVGKDFKLVQNEKAFNAFDRILKSHNAQFVTGGWYHNGASCFLQARLPHTTTLDKGDSVRRYLIIAQGHTGLQSLTMRFTNIRPVCTNTLISALRDDYHSFTLRHTASINERMDDAVKYMELGLQHLGRAEHTFKEMQKVMLDPNQIKNYLKLCYDRPLADPQDEKDRWRKWDDIEPVFLKPTGGHMSEGTLWHGYNILTEFEDHHSRVIKQQGTPKSVLLTDTDRKQTRQWRAMLGSKTIETKVKGFQIADEVIRGKRDLNTGQYRSQPTRGGLKGLFAGLNN
jgi:phage/plasmid-like protein (TIGR03299 family)